MPKKIIIIGGGAAGFFLAANLPKSDKYEIEILEKSAQVLQKVKISGGGRCNVTHACFEPNELVTSYPRGEKELRSVFHKFQPGDCMAWFEDRGVALKIENDNRIFPISNNSQSIIDALYKGAQKNARITTKCGLKSIKNKGETFLLETVQGNKIADVLILATGSSKQMWGEIEKLGHKIISPVPSLFTFTIKDKELHELSGVSFTYSEVTIPALKLTETGPLIITHWGLSGPAVLRLSAFAALELAELKYNFKIQVNWLGLSFENVLKKLISLKNDNLNLDVKNRPLQPITKRFWFYILKKCTLENKKWSQLSKINLEDLAHQLTKTSFDVNGKSTFKDEFVTAGGINRKEIDFRTMESKLVQNLFFAGETIDIDAVTGGFNFQACWSGAFVIADHLSKKIQ